MEHRIKLFRKYLLSLSGILLLSGTLLLVASGYFDWHSLIENYGLALTAAGITTFLLKYDIHDSLADTQIRRAGIEAIKHGRGAMVDTVGGISAFLHGAHPREIDICGMAMYSFFEPNSMYNTLLDLAAAGYKIRIAFADPESPELRLQEEAEHKIGTLTAHINHLVKTISDAIAQHPHQKDVQKRIKIVYSRNLPKCFIVRAGNHMLVTTYLLRGPHGSPTLHVANVPDGIFAAYKQYLDDVFTTLSRPALGPCHSAAVDEKIFENQ